MEQQLQAVFMLTNKPIISKDPTELKDHPLNETLFGDLNKPDYHELKEDIAKRGIQDPLHITKDNVIVSGHQRRKIAEELGINVPCIIRKDLKEDWQIEEQLISDNLLRRQLSDFQRVECGERLYNIYHKKAEVNKKIAANKMNEKLGNKHDETINLKSDKTSKVDTLKEVSEKVGLKRDKYSKARKVYHEAPHDIKQKWQREQLSTHAAYRWLQNNKRKEQRKQPTETPEFPNDTYDVIYADPPWRYDFPTSLSREIEQKYPTMTIDELKDLDLPVNENAVLYMWATSTLLPKAIELMEKWGFTYKTHAVWDKEKIGMGFWFRGRHELLLVGTKGTFSPPETNKRVGSIFRIPRTKHSKKPDAIREHIANCFPNHKKLELFARTKHPDWDVWGNEIDT